jgi:adenylate cyclase
VKKHLVRIGFGVLVMLVFIGHAARYYRIPLIDRLEAILYDTRLKVTMPNGVDPRIVIVDIDEKSLKEPKDGGEGRWPWSRNRVALLITNLVDKYGAAIVGFDVVFAERDESSGLQVLEQLGATRLKDVAPYHEVLAQIRPSLKYDEVFATAIKDRPVVLGYYFSLGAVAEGETMRETGVLPPPVLPSGTFAGKNIGFERPVGFGSNLPELMNVAASAGHFTPSVDEDGIVRSVPMLIEYKNGYFEALSLSMIRALLGFPKVVPGYPSDALYTRNYSGLEWLQVGPVRIPVDEQVRALVPYRGAQGSFKYVSAADVIQGRSDPADLKGKIVLVGTSAPGLLDLRATPVANAYAGVEIHANLIAGMLDKSIRQKPPYVIGAEVTLLFLTGMVLALLLPLLNPLKALVTSVVVLIGAIVVNVLIYTGASLVLPLASGVLMILMLFTLNMAYGFFVETRGKRQITGLFGQYVPPALVDEMAKNPEKFSMEGESREMTVLFSDVRGFTTISEGLDPKELSLLMNSFLTPLTEVIYKHRGTIDKYMGDCIMAFWGAPVEDPEHARNGVLAGLEMHQRLHELQPEFQSRGWPEIKIGVGLNTGRMSVGNMGSKIRLAYTVMGDAVNLASRLEGITKQYGARVLVGEGTKAKVPDVVFREIDRVRVKGKLEPVAIFEPLGLQGQVDRKVLDETKLFYQAVKLLRSQDWDMAELQLINLQKSNPDAVLYKEYLSRLVHYRSNPPGQDWDGAYTFDHK